MDGKSLKEVAEEYPTTFIKYARGIASYKFVLFSPAEWRDLTVTVLWGPTGTGKTKKAVTVDSVFILTDKWFCGYNGEKRLVIDEFYGWLPWCSLLRICDGYKYQCETKGAKYGQNGRRLLSRATSLPSSGTSASTTLALYYDGLQRLRKWNKVSIYEPFKSLRSVNTTICSILICTCTAAGFPPCVFIKYTIHEQP